MKTILAVVVVCIAAVIVIWSAACKKGERKAVSPTAGEAEKATAVLEVVGSSDKYRRLFNETAEAVYGFQWVKDTQNPGRVDVELGELYIPQAIRPKFGLSQEGISLTQQLSDAIIEVEKIIQAQRKAAVKKTLAAQRETHLWFDLGKLSEPYQKAARYLVEASYFMHELYKLQLDKNAPDTEARVYKEGDPDSVRLFQRNAAAICGRYAADAACSVLSDYYEPQIGAIMWPDGMSEKIFEDIKANAKDPKADPFLSPFTVVKKGDDGQLKAIPYAKFPPFAAHFEKIASLMEQAADVEGIDKSFSDQLKLQAQAFRSDDPRPYFQSDEAWGKAKGELDLTVGPYETYEDPYSTKAFFEFCLGAEDKAATEVVQKFMPLLPHIERMFALAVGTDVYKAREITTIPPLRVINVIAGSGEMRKAGGPSIAFSLPNIGPMAEEGRSKRVIFANHHEAKYPILRAIAEIALVPEQLGDVDAQSFVFDSAFHEIMHGIGPQRETNAGGSTVALMIGEDYDGIEEAKANVGGVWAAKFLLDNGVITADQLRKIHTTYVAGLLRIMRFGAKEAHARGAALEFSYLFSKGAIETRGDRFAINHEKMQEALNGLVAEIGSALAKGDKAAVKALLEGYPAKAPALLEEMARKFASAGIPRDVALVYHVTGR